MQTEPRINRTITTPDEFVDVGMSLSSEHVDWKTEDYMKKMHLFVLRGAKSGKANKVVYELYFVLHAMLSTSKMVSQTRIRATILGMSDWLTKTH
jgi:hypothetical protein